MRRPNSTLALILASRRNVALEAERMKRGDWPCTLSHRLRGSTLGIFGLGAIGSLVAQGGHGLGMKVLVWGQDNIAGEGRGCGIRVSPPARPSCSSAPTCSRCIVRLHARDARASSARTISPA